MDWMGPVTTLILQVPYLRCSFSDLGVNSVYVEHAPIDHPLAVSFVEAPVSGSDGLACINGRELAQRRWDLARIRSVAGHVEPQHIDSRVDEIAGRSASVTLLHAVLKVDLIADVILRK